MKKKVQYSFNNLNTISRIVIFGIAALLVLIVFFVILDITRNNNFVSSNDEKYIQLNELYEENGAGEDSTENIMEGIRFLIDHSCLLVVVTNEVFAESVPDSPEMTVYKEVLGTVNCRMAGMADQVTEVVYGIPVEVKR